MNGVALLAGLSTELIARFGDHEHDDELTRARDFYSDRRGRVFEDDEQWESFSSAFLEWYVVERAWRDTGKCPALLELASEPDSYRRRGLRALATSQRSVVEIQRLGKNSIELIDLVGGTAFKVREERSLVGMSPGDIVEVRLVGFAEQVSFGRTFVYHPAGVRNAVCDRIADMQKSGADRADVIDHLAALRTRSRSYRHVSSVRMYESDGQLATRE